MKTLLLTAFLCITSALLSQTSVISLKSHHGKATDITKTVDRFGEIAPTPIFDTLIKINNDCVIQIGNDNGWGIAFRDTVCHHWYYKEVNYDAKKIKQFHGNNIELIGFENNENGTQSQKSPYFKKRTKKQSAKWLFLIIALTALGTYIIRPRFTSSKS